MGPRSFNRGNASKSAAIHRVRDASMGPRSFNRGNSTIAAQHAHGRTVLQWGRGLSTAEMTCVTRSGSELGVASMGPRSFNRGNASDAIGR